MTPVASDWVAATVRARSMARRRAGHALIGRVAAAGNLATAGSLLEETAYAQRLRPDMTLRGAQRSTRQTVLWEIRVLAGWVPPGGTALLRAAAAEYELENILALERRLSGRPLPPTEPFELGSLATAWPRVREADSLGELQDQLRRSPWGLPEANPAAVLAAVRLRRLMAAAPEAADAAARTCAVLAARTRLVGGTEPPPRMVSLLRPVLGTEWAAARTVSQLREALPGRLRPVLDAVQGPADLWRAEASVPVLNEGDGFRLLRGGTPGPGVVAGAVLVLGADAWRLRAALAAAAGEDSSSEVLNAVA